MSPLPSAVRVPTGPPPQPPGPQRHRLGSDLTVLALAVAAGALAAILGWAVGEPSAPGRDAAASGLPAAQQESAGARPAYAELPREWRWRRAPVRFERMYRTEHDAEAASARPGWLRTEP